MCDEQTVRDAEEALRGTRGWSRRGLGLSAGAAGLAMMLPRAAHALDVTETDVTVPTPDGEADCYFVHPASGRHPGVIMWPDILGLRPAFPTQTRQWRFGARALRSQLRGQLRP